MGKQGFGIQLLLVTALLGGAYLLAKHQLGFELADWKAYLLLGSFALVTYFSHNAMLKAIGDRPTLFANRFMASIIIKLVLGAILFIGIALTSTKPEVMPFGIVFLVVYLSYTFFGSYHASQLRDRAKG